MSMTRNIILERWSDKDMEVYFEERAASFLESLIKETNKEK
jgi:hypothetical protein